MQLSQIEETLTEQLRALEQSERASWRGLRRLSFRRKPAEEGRQTPARRPDRRGDLIIAGLGVALGLGCALFPWYIFLNQEKFGIRALEFSGGGQARGMPGLSLRGRADRPSSQAMEDDVAIKALDPFATGALPDRRQFTPPGEQPFPAEPVEFHLVHIANGRAMIADDAGLWVVQRGSLLPDNSRVSAIEQRGGEWVLITSADKVLKLAQ